MDIRYEPSKRTMIVKLAGDLDHHSAAAARGEIDRKFRTSKASNIIFDMSDLKFMDSSGIGLLMGRYKLASPLGGKVFLTGVSSRLDRLISISGIYKLVSWADSINDALRKV
jgi:stage II sporulation protein AA (anti-sigma F factor antagonist)